MTVRDMIKELQKYDPELPVKITRKEEWNSESSWWSTEEEKNPVLFDFGSRVMIDVEGG